MSHDYAQNLPVVVHYLAVSELWPKTCCPQSSPTSPNVQGLYFNYSLFFKSHLVLVVLAGYTTMFVFSIPLDTAKPEQCL
jgi:hypothetical protein